MNHFPALVHPIPAPTPYHLERRVSRRHLCGAEAVSRPLDQPESVCWGAVVRDVSDTGVGLTVCYPFRPGTYLAVDLQSPAEARTLLARVVRVEDSRDGTWLLGCELVKSLVR